MRRADVQFSQLGAKCDELESKHGSRIDELERARRDAATKEWAVRVRWSLLDLFMHWTAPGLCTRIPRTQPARVRACAAGTDGKGSRRRRCTSERSGAGLENRQRACEGRGDAVLTLIERAGRDVHMSVGWHRRPSPA